MSISVSLLKNDNMYILELLQQGQMCMCEPLYNKWNHKYFFFTFERYKEKDAACNIDCFGNRGEKCGGYLTYSIYRILAGKQRKLKDIVKKVNLYI